MKSYILLRACVALALTVLLPAAYPCTWAVGYFRQVTRLRGTVVGVKDGDWRHPFRWRRQQVVRGDVKLTLYEYRWPVKARRELSVVKVIRADQHGDFDFGAIQKGPLQFGDRRPWGWGFVVLC
jgi:hypothetical protein